MKNTMKRKNKTPLYTLRLLRDGAWKLELASGQCIGWYSGRPTERDALLGALAHAESVGDLNLASRCKEALQAELPA